MSISKDFYPVGVRIRFLRRVTALVLGVRIRFLRRVTALVLGGGLLLGLPGGAWGQSESAAATDDTTTHVHGVKCLTPLILALSEGGESADPRWHQLFESITGFDALSADVVRGAISGQQALEMLGSELAQDLLQYESPAGKFIIEYTTEGATAVPTADLNANGIPDYVERAAEYADFSHFALVDSLGFVDPRVNGAPMQIRFVAGTSYGFYNYGTQPNILFVHKDFVGFPQNRDPDGHQLGALKVTIAHELKHAIQFRTNGFVGDAGSANWAELDATMTEEVVYPMVKDYLNYLNMSNSLFRANNPAIPSQTLYDQATFGLFYHEYFGPTFWTAVWNRIRISPRMRMFDAIALEVQSRGEDPRREYLRNIAWHMASGNRTRPGIGFASAALYPSRTAGGLSFAEQKLPGVTAQVTMNANSVRFYEITASAQWNGRVAVALLRENSSVGAGILIFKRNGTLELQFLEVVTPGGLDALVTGVNWGETDRVGLVLANMGTSTVRTQIAYGAADPPQTSGTLPPGLFRYGDLQRDGQVGLVDTEQFVTEFITRNGPFAATTLDLVRRPAHDLSGNGTITPFDAALLLSRLRGNPAPFPADVAGDGWFYRFADFRQQQPPAVFSKNAAFSGNTAEANEITNAPIVTNRFTVGDTPDNDTLSIYLEVSAEAAFRGAYFDVRYDTSLIGLASAKFLPSPASLPSSGITAETTVIPAHILDWDETALGLRLTLISASPNISGTFLRLQFQPKKDTLVSVRFPRVYLDELPEITQTGTIDARVRPKEGVSIEPPGTLPQQTTLLGNYPNPFNPSTTLVFRLGEATHTRLSVYDVTGRLVATLQNGVLSGGEHALRFDAGNLASGVYIVRLETTQVYTAKMLLVK